MDEIVTRLKAAKISPAAKEFMSKIIRMCNENGCSDSEARIDMVCAEYFAEKGLDVKAKINTIHNRRKAISLAQTKL